MEGTDSGTRPCARRSHSLEERSAYVDSREKGDWARPRGKRGCPGGHLIWKRASTLWGSLGSRNLVGGAQDGAVAWWIQAAEVAGSSLSLCVSAQSFLCFFSVFNHFPPPQPKCLLLLSREYRSASCVSEAPSQPVCATAHREG